MAWTLFCAIIAVGSRIDTVADGAAVERQLGDVVHAKNDRIVRHLHNRTVQAADRHDLIAFFSEFSMVLRCCCFFF